MAATGEGPGYGTRASVFERDAVEPLSRLDRSPNGQRLTLTEALDSVPAEVAMRSGMLPSQQRALRRVFKKADAFDHFRTRTRRAFLGLFGLSALGATATYWLGQRAGDTAAPVANQAATDLEALALGPLDALEQAHPLLIAYLDLHSADAKPGHWLGLERLALLALTEPEAKRALGREVTRLVEVRGCPAATRPVIDKLRSKLR